jgi:hypothetical protein
MNRTRDLPVSSIVPQSTTMKFSLFRCGSAVFTVRESKKIRRQALVQFTITSDMFEGVFMISPQLSNDAIIGCYLLISREETKPTK